MDAGFFGGNMKEEESLLIQQELKDFFSHTHVKFF